MAPSSRHLYPEWLRPRSAQTGAPSDGPHSDGAWRVWEWLRAIDRRYATLVDVVLAAGLFFVCSGWAIERTASRPDLWFVAALIVPLVFRRRAPMSVFLVIAAVAFVQWLVTAPALADSALLVALYTVALESAWLLVAAATVILEVGVVMATARWTPTGNDLKSFVFLTGLVLTALLAGVVVRALRSQLDWLAERAERLELERDQQATLAAVTERARIAREMHDVVSHNIQVMVTLADAASMAQAADPARAAEAIHEVSSTGRQALTDMRRMLGVLREEPAPAGTNGAAGGDGRGPLAPQPGLRELDPLVERVRGTGPRRLGPLRRRALRGLGGGWSDRLPHRARGPDQRPEACGRARLGGGAAGLRRPRRVGADHRRRPDRCGRPIVDGCQPGRPSRGDGWRPRVGGHGGTGDGVRRVAAGRAAPDGRLGGRSHAA